jgi:hypothetical protein
MVAQQPTQFTDVRRVLPPRPASRTFHGDRFPLWPAPPAARNKTTSGTGCPRGRRRFVLGVCDKPRSRRPMAEPARSSSSRDFRTGLPAPPLMAGAETRPSNPPRVKFHKPLAAITESAAACPSRRRACSPLLPTFLRGNLASGSKNRAAQGRAHNCTLHTRGVRIWGSLGGPSATCWCLRS